MKHRQSIKNLINIFGVKTIICPTERTLNLMPKKELQDRLSHDSYN